MITGRTRTMTATEFKAKCLAILDEVCSSGERLTILKRGRPVAELGPVSHDHDACPQHGLRGSVVVKGDIVGPALPEEHWESLAR